MRRTITGLLSALIIASPIIASAQQANEAETNANVRVAQAGSDARLAEFEALLNETAGLQTYNQLLQRQIQTQQQEVQALRANVEQVPALERQIPPLLERMVQGLADFIELDIPFLAEERNQRLAELQALVERTDVNVAEKFRRIMEAWEIENEYGRTVSAYVGELDVGGEVREVDFLRVGRVAWIYQTTDDDANTGAWDPRTETWVALGGQHRNSVGQAIRMARAQIAPDLVLIPIAPPSAE
jgi:hypothetical protein